jgi:predicted ribosome quality control (RQC) complex YloA/Tae2 family protein
MALDGIFIKSIKDELNEILIDGKVEKVNQPEKDEIVLTIRKGRVNQKLLISSSSNYPRLHITNLNKPNPLKAPMFCMVLRKYLSNAKLISIEQVNNDRIVMLNFESRDEMGFDSNYTLYVEIMGRHSNITLVRQRDMMVMDSIKHLTEDNNSFRSVFPGVEFMLPPVYSKLNPFEFTLEDFTNLITKEPLEFNERLFMTLFAGISINISKILYEETMDKGLNLNDLNSLYDFINNYFSSLNSKPYSFNIYSEDGELKDFYCYDPPQFSCYDKSVFSSASLLLEEYYNQKDKKDRLKNKSASVNKIITNNINRCVKKEKILNKTLEECESKDQFRLKGELLTANIHAIDKGVDSIKLLNYYEPEETWIDISIDPYKSPSQNVQKYYKKYNKLKKSEEAAYIQLESNEEELNYLNSVLTHLNNCDNYKDIDELRKELIESGYIKKKAGNKKDKSKPSKPLHFVSSEGVDLYVGKNNIQNDELTLKFAAKNDIWFHTKEIPGSHVIVRFDERITDITLEEAANLAAFYSKGKNSTKVPVDYTEIKNIKKPNGSKPGMVIYYTNKTVYIDPKAPKLEEAKSK